MNQKEFKKEAKFLYQYDKTKEDFYYWVKLMCTEINEIMENIRYAVPFPGERVMDDDIQDIDKWTSRVSAIAELLQMEIEKKGEKS